MEFIEQHICRFLRSRAETDENAKILATLMENGRGIDAVVLDSRKLEAQENILDFSKLSYYLVKVGEQPLLLYPYEEREKYLGIKDRLRFGDGERYAGFSFSEMEAIKDYLDASGTDCQFSMGDGIRMEILVSKKDRAHMDKAIRRLQTEIASPEGLHYLTTKNQCWANTVSQVSKALGADMAYIGSDGGQDGIWIDQKGASVITTQGSEFIPRHTNKFDETVINQALTALHGSDTPIKAFFGKDMEWMSYGMGTSQNKALKRSEALSVLGVQESPGLGELKVAMETADNEREKIAAKTLAVMEVCRAMHVEGIEKLSRSEKEAYRKMHAGFVKEFTAGIGRGEEHTVEISHGRTGGDGYEIGKGR